MANYNFCYNIIDVVKALNLTVRKWNSTTLDCDCPYCTVNPENGHDGKGKLQIVIGKNLAHCCRCNSGGGMLELYGYVRGVDVKQAHNEMKAFVGRTNYKREINKNRELFLQAQNIVKNGSKKVSDEVLNKTYRAFLASCKLSDNHKAELTSPKRGLTLKQIKGFGIKSVPTHREEHKQIINSLLKQNIQLNGVPGFFTDKSGNWNFNLFRYAEGFLIPVINIKKQVIGLQIRLDNPLDNNKYIWLSSANKNKGTSSGSPIHLTSSKPSKTIFLTEGPLKANIAYSLSKRTFAAVAGVTQYRNLPTFFQELKANGTVRIVDCFDSDSQFNQQVENARQKLKRIVLENDLNYTRMSWDSDYKGIDDYMLNIPQNKWKFHCQDYNQKNARSYYL